MKLSRRTGMTVAVVLTLLAAGVITNVSAWDTDPLGTVVTRHNHMCATNDLPEGRIQGDIPKADQLSGRAKKGYNCGLSLVGYTPLTMGGRPNINANMAWAGHCAYVAGFGGLSITPEVKSHPPPGSGVAVVSVDPTTGIPTHVANLRAPGALETAETLNAVTTPQGRSILVVGQYGVDAISPPKPMDIYDVSNPDCTKFKHLATYYWPDNIHNLTLSHDGRYVFATIPLQAVDISGLWANPPTGVRFLGNIQNVMDGPLIALGPTTDVFGALPSQVQSLSHPQNVSHEAWLSEDDKTLYVGGQTPQYETLAIVDISPWLDRDGAGNPLGTPRVISEVSGRGHSVRTATIGGKPYLLHSEESVLGAAYGCIPQEANPFAGPAQPWLTDISNPAHPKTVSQFGLDINEPGNCPEQLSAGEQDSVHYHDVDDPTDTTFVMASMWNAGLRVFDVRDPRNPTEVAYFNPGDIDPRAGQTQLDHAWGHIRWLPETGQIWFASANGGFWVVRMEGQVRHYLGLDAKNSEHGRRGLRVPLTDPGRPGILGVTLPQPLGDYLDVTRYYCTLGATFAPAGAIRPIQRP